MRGGGRQGTPYIAGVQLVGNDVFQAGHASNAFKAPSLKSVLAKLTKQTFEREGSG